MRYDTNHHINFEIYDIYYLFLVGTKQGKQDHHLAKQGQKTACSKRVIGMKSPPVFVITYIDLQVQDQQEDKKQDSNEKPRKREIEEGGKGDETTQEKKKSRVEEPGTIAEIVKVRRRRSRDKK